MGLEINQHMTIAKKISRLMMTKKHNPMINIRKTQGRYLIKLTICQQEEDDNRLLMSIKEIPQH